MLPNNCWHGWRFLQSTNPPSCSVVSTTLRSWQEAFLRSRWPVARIPVQTFPWCRTVSTMNQPRNTTRRGRNGGSAQSKQHNEETGITKVMTSLSNQKETVSSWPGWFMVEFKVLSHFEDWFTGIYWWRHRIQNRSAGRTRLCRAWVLCNCCPYNCLYWDSCCSMLCRSFLNLKQLLHADCFPLMQSSYLHGSCGNLQINQWNLLTHAISPCICTITVGTITFVCREDLSWCSLPCVPENKEAHTAKQSKDPCSKDLYII